MNSKTILFAALPSMLLVLGFTTNVASAETFEFAGQKYNLQSKPINQGTVIERFEFAGQKYAVIQAKRGNKGSDLAALELHDEDNDLIYGDEDMSIVLTGAR